MMSRPSAASRRSARAGPARAALRPGAIVVAALALVAWPAPARAQELPWSELAAAVVERLQLEPGERVLLVCRPGRFEEIVPEMRYAIMRAGGVDLGCLDVIGQPYPRGWDRDVVEQGWQASRAALRSWLADVDAAVMLPGAWPTEPAYVALQDLLAEGKGRLRAIHFHWSGAYDFASRQLDLDERVHRSYARAVLDTDYAALAAAQRDFVSAARGAEIRVTTPAGTDVRFRIGDRPVTLQDGDASAARAAGARVLIEREIEVPAGAIRVAPLEESVEGVILFPESRWNGEWVRDVRLRFERGRVVRVEAPTDAGRAAVRAELDEGGPAARAFREFALGFNPLLAIPEGARWIPYYGYGAGVVRLSLGDNRELGGRVEGDYVRWNFFPDATVTVGGDVRVRAGRLVP